MEKRKVIKEIEKAVQESNSKGEVMDLIVEKDVLEDELKEVTA